MTRSGGFANITLSSVPVRAASSRASGRAACRVDAAQMKLEAVDRLHALPP
jgi:hypothetical protein